MDTNKIKEFINARKQLLIIVPVILLLMIGVVYISNRKKTQEDHSKPSSEVAFEPTAEDEKLPANKRVAYESLQLNERRKKRIEESPLVKGSEFYFSMAEKDEKFEEQINERIARMKEDPYDNLMSEYEENPETGSNEQRSFSDRMKTQLDEIEDEETLNQIVHQAKKDERLRNQLREEDLIRQKQYRDLGILPEKNESKEITVTTPVEDVKDDTEEKVEEPDTGSAIIIENGKRHRRQKVVIPKHTNLIKACIHGDQVLVSGSIVRMRLLEPLTSGGLRIPENTIFSGEVTLGANRLSIVVKNLKKGAYMSPVSFVIYDNDAIEGLNLPNNMKAEAARQMERGLVNGVQLPMSSIGTISAEVSSAISTTTQVAKQIFNMRLSQIKVHVKANYQMYIQEESKDAKKKREAVEAELDNLYKKMEEQQSDPANGNPLRKLIDQL